jgi:type I restriction-modification system DNA methylase subunit
MPNSLFNDSRLDLSTLESWLWEAACALRGPVDAPKFKDYLLPLAFLKRLSDVFEDELAHLAQEFGGRSNTKRLVEQDHKLVRFYIPEKAVVLLREAEEERAEADRGLQDTLMRLGLGGQRDVE